MAHKVVQAGEIEARHGVFRPLTEPLGVAAFKVNQLEFPPGHEGPEHDHAGNGEEEVYVVVSGSGTLRIGDEEIAVEPGSYVFCSPDTRRQLKAGDDGLVFVGIGRAEG